MNNSRIIIRFVSSGILVLPSRAAAGQKGDALPGFYSVVDGRLALEAVEYLKSFDPARKSDVVLILPRRQVIFKYFTLPSRNADELRRMIDLQIGRGLPFPVGEMVYQMMILGVDDQGLSQVVVAIAQKKMVQECLDIVVHSGLDPSHCSLSAFGVAAWFARRFPSDSEKCVLVVDVDEDGLEFCFCQNKRLMFARGISLSVDGQGSEGLKKQVELTLGAFKDAYPQANVAKVMLTGVKGRSALVKEVIGHLTQLPCEDVDVDDAPDTDSHEKTLPASLCALRGMASTSNLGPDLMPRALRHSQYSRQELMALLRMCATFLMLVGACSFWANQRLNIQREALGSLRQSVSASKAEFDQARRKIRIYENFRNDRSNRIVVVDLFKELYGMVPASVALTNIQYSDGSLSIIGQTRESADVGSVQKAMMNSPLFKDVTLQYANRPQRLAMEYTEFKIVCRVHAPRGGGI